MALFRDPDSIIGMHAHALNPILNVSDFAESVKWFEKLGWEKAWDWGTPPTFGSVCCGECQIFLCENGQGGRGKGSNTTTFVHEGDSSLDKGVWISIWVNDVDAEHRNCLARGLDVTAAPADYPWNVREMHVRHPDGHVFRISQSLGESE